MGAGAAGFKPRSKAVMCRKAALGPMLGDRMGTGIAAGTQRA